MRILQSFSLIWKAENEFQRSKLGDIDCVDSAALLGFAVAQRQPTCTAKILCQGF